MHYLAEDLGNGQTLLWIGTGIVALTVFVIVIIMSQFIGLYVRATVSGARVGFTDLLGMRLRKVNALAIVNARIQAVRAGLDISTSEMESHALAGGKVQQVVAAMILASKANIDMPWKTASAIDLAGRDVLREVQAGVKHWKPDAPSQH